MVMKVHRNVSLAEHSTMRLGGLAAYLTEVSRLSEVEEAVAWAGQHQVLVMMIGSGSNIVWGDGGYPGLVIVNQIMGFETTQEENNAVLVRIGGGENWDHAVERTVGMSLHGIESLSLIPGTAGATPVQNVGAYGQEIANTLVNVETYDTQAKKFVTIMAADCGFGYRTSRFKTTDKGRFFITAINLRLARGNPKPPFYQSVQDYFSAHATTDITPQAVRQAVIAIRTSKLPDPAKVANNGSFFQNPVIGTKQFAELAANYPDMTHWTVGDSQVKVAAGWLVEKAGFKDMHDKETGMATWPAQALVLVNEHARSTADLLKFRQKIIDKVQEMFGLTLVQEPELIGE